MWVQDINSNGFPRSPTIRLRVVWTLLLVTLGWLAIRCRHFCCCGWVSQLDTGVVDWFRFRLLLWLVLLLILLM